VIGSYSFLCGCSYETPSIINNGSSLENCAGDIILFSIKSLRIEDERSCV
jgi:hypothetical protein